MKYIAFIFLILFSGCEKTTPGETPLDFQEWIVYQQHTTEPSNVDHFLTVYASEVPTDTVIRFTSNHVYIGTRTPGRLDAACSGWHTVDRNLMRVNWTFPVPYVEDFQLFDAPGWWVMRSQHRAWMIKKP